MCWLLESIKIHLKRIKYIDWYVVMPAANTWYRHTNTHKREFSSFSFFFHIVLCSPLFELHLSHPERSWTLDIQSPSSSLPNPQRPDSLSTAARPGNISLTYSVINILHWESLSELVRLVSEDLRASEGGKVPGVWCQTCQLEPTPQSASDLNKCGQPGPRVPKSMEHAKVNTQTATYIQLQTGGRGLWATGWEGEGGESVNSLHFTYYRSDVQGYSAVIWCGRSSSALLQQWHPKVAFSSPTPTWLQEPMLFLL